MINYITDFIYQTSIMSDKILEKVIKTVSPTQDYNEKTINALIKKLNSVLKSGKLKATAVLGGSLAKGTNLKEDFDADIFVKFDASYGSNKISDLLEKILKKMKLKCDRVHGSRDYFQTHNKFLIELVPVLNVKNWKEIKNVADMSPLHVEYFLSKANNDKRIRDEIRITKAFLKSARIYGAESYIRGFSGHVVDLLIINYGSFTNLLKKAEKWKDKTIIDIEKHHKHVLMTLNESKIENPLIIVDPIQPQRNAAAAVSMEAFKEFIKKAKEYNKKPALEYFEKKEFSSIINVAKKKFEKKGNYFELSVTPLIDKKDVAGSKVLKIKSFLETKLLDNEFKILWSDWEFSFESSKISIIIDKKMLSEEKIIEGPATNMLSIHINAFKKKHKNTYLEENRYYAKEKRKYRCAEELLVQLINIKYVKDKCKKIMIKKNF